jgi:hypothetical protein
VAQVVTKMLLLAVMLMVALEHLAAEAVKVAVLVAVV